MTLILFKVLAMILSVALGAGMLARDHGLAANRLIAAFFFCNAWWAGSEVFLYRTEDPAVALELYRWMTLGWAPLGILCMHGSLCLSSLRDHPAARATPFFYAAIAVMIPLAIGTDWFIEGAVRQAPGWRPIFGPAFFVAYLLLAAPLMSILGCWRRLMNLPGRGGQNELACVVFFGVSAAFVIGTLTAVVLPILGMSSVGVTSSLLGGVGVVAAWTLRRHGYSLISPESFAREILDTLEDGVVVVGEGGFVRDANRAFCEMTGVHQTAIVGHPITSSIPSFPADFASLEPSTFMDIHCGNGDALPVVVSAPVRLIGRRRLIGHAFLVRDRREIVLLQRQLAVSGRLAAVGDLSKSISESIQVPATETRRQLEMLSADWEALRSGLEQKGWLEECHEAVSEGFELIEECIEGVDRVNAIVHEVGSFSADSRRRGFARHDLSEIVECALRIACVQAKPNVEVEARFDADVEVLCHRPELERLVTNLLVNAFQALEAEGAGEAHLSIAVCAQGKAALLHVEDDGCGIAPDVLERVFDPFFTTKPVGKGTGLGLAISYHIVRKHGGQIRVSSIEGNGTSVAVQLPRAPAAAPREDPG